MSHEPAASVTGSGSKVLSPRLQACHTRASAVLRGRTGGPGPARGNPERLLVERDRLDRQIVLSGEGGPVGGGLGGEGAFESVVIGPEVRGERLREVGLDAGHGDVPIGGGIGAVEGSAPAEGTAR